MLADQAAGPVGDQVQKHNLRARGWLGNARLAQHLLEHQSYHSKGSKQCFPQSLSYLEERPRK